MLQLQPTQVTNTLLTHPIPYNTTQTKQPPQNIAKYLHNTHPIIFCRKNILNDDLGRKAYTGFQVGQMAQFLIIIVRTLLFMSKQIATPLINSQNLDQPKALPASTLPPEALDFEYKEFSGEPAVTFSKLTLVILAPVLVVIHIAVAHFFHLPMIQYSFVTSLTAFIINYTWIIRKHELMPYLPVQSFDNKLKVLCVLSLVGMLLSMHFGWNGSGGIIFAVYWELTRGSKMGSYGYFFSAIIVGSLLMENNYSVSKLWEFLPGLIFGYVNAEIFKLKDSNPYTIAHQFIFLCSIGLPIFFPASKLVVPSLLQWAIMVIFGAVLLFTIIITIKLMQLCRVSVTMGVFSGLLILGTSTYSSGIDYLGLALIGAGIILLVKKEFLDVQF